MKHRAGIITALTALAVGAVFVAPALAESSSPDVTCVGSTVGADGRFSLDCVVPVVPATSEPAPSNTPSPTQPQVTPSPTSSAAPTPTPTPSPAATGWPDAATTGATGPLTLRQGGLTISTAGAVVENLDIRGCVTINAANAVLRNVRVSCSNGWGISVNSTGGTIIENVDVTCNGTLGKGVVGEGFTLRGSDVSGCEDAVYIRRNVNVLDSYLHDLYGGGTDPHNDVVQVVNGGDNVLIQGNYLSNRTDRATSGYMGDGSGMDNIAIDRNLIEAGGYAVYCSASGVGNAVTGNTIDATGYGPWYWTCSRSGIVRTGNTLI